MAGLASITLVAGLFVAGPASATTMLVEDSAGSGGAAVEPELLDVLAAEEVATFWVYLDAQADLSAASALSDRDDQGWAVFEELTQTAESSQAGLLDLLRAEDVPFESFWIANTVKVTGGADLVDKVAAYPGVAQVTADKSYALPEPEPADEQNRVNAVEWNIDRVKAPQVWSEFGVTGEDIVIGSIDTGVDFDHPAVVAQYRGNLGGSFDHNYNWWDPSNVCGNPSLVPCDNNNHGTHTVGTMVGDDGGDNQIGVAPGAQWMAAKGCESSSCSQTALLESGQFMLAPTDLQGDNPNPELRPHILNNSWGGGADTDPWYQPTVQAWVAAGIFPQFASGNPGSACGAAGNPGNLPESYAAGAFDINDNLYINSGRGPSAWGGDIIKPNITAPGVAVRSAVNGGGYAAFTGTSMASPHVAAAVALLWSAAPSLIRDIDTTRDILDGTAEDTEDLTCGGTPDNNNVWGQGKLDTHAALTQAPTGPVGTLTGTITDTTDNTPIPGATITITGDHQRQRTTDTDGTYTTTLPVGDYTITVEAFGYQPDTDTITITENTTTTHDVALTAAASVTITGTVTDGSGHGWPLYTHITVNDTPINTHTNPLTGQYTLTLPQNNTYTLQYTPQYPGYTTHTQTITTTDTDQTVDAALIAERCEQAPGYEFGAKVGVLADYASDPVVEFLAGRGIPADTLTWADDKSGYDVIVINGTAASQGGGDPGEAAFLDFLADTDAEGTGVVFLDQWSTSGRGNGVWLLWQYLNNPSERGTGFSSAIPYLYYEVTQEHPVLEGFAVGDEIIFDDVSGSKDHAWFGGYEGEDRQVIANAGRADTGVLGQGIGVQERANNRHVLLSMHSSGAFNGPRYWHEDSAQVFVNSLEWAATDASFECQLVEGGLVLGNVYDQNTGDALNGATVTSAANPDDTSTSFATPADPGLDDGFYWLFSSQTGSQEFTASAGNYSSSTQAVDVAADGVVGADFSLAAGQLTVDPAQVEADVAFGRSADRSFTITNTGTAPVEVELSERRSGFEILNTDGSTSATDQVTFPGTAGEVSRVPAQVSFTATAAVTGDENTADAAAEPAQDVPAADVPAQDAWESLPDMPRGIMDNNVVLVEDTLYSFGGTDGSTAVAEVYAYDTGTGTWDRLADAPAVVQQSAEGVIDGQVYLAGSFAGLSADTWIYDPAADSWSAGAPMPAGRAAPGSAVLDGQLYVVGGCTTNSCTPMTDTVYRYDPAADSWDTLAPYPEAAAFVSCGAATGLLVCTGGVNSSSQGLATTYAYDPATNVWQQRADMPVDLWASAYTGANDMLLVSGGAALNGAVVTNEGYAYDPTTDTWTALPPAGNALYRGGGACGFHKAGGSIGSFNEAAFAEVLPGYDTCGTPTDVPWLTIDTTTATIQPGDTITITVSMDSSATEEQQPGTYTTGVGIRHNTPYPVNPVDVTMNVAPPNNWGKITGTITATTDTGDPITGALVHINGTTDHITLTTGNDGTYGYWLPVTNNPLQLIVSAAGYIPQTRDTQLKPRQTTTENFTLHTP